MKRSIFLFATLLTIFYACQDSEVVNDFTGNEVTYSLQQGSEFAVNGSVTFKERKDGAITATISLSGTEGTEKFPVHLHLGDVSEPDAEIALLLAPVQASTGQSETIIRQLGNEETINYEQLLKLSASIKIHLGETGPERDVILAAGNIGTAATTNITGRTTISVCKSE